MNRRRAAAGPREPARWREQPPGATAAELCAGAQLRRLPDPVLPDALALERIKRRIDAVAASAQPQRARTFLRYALVIVVVSSGVAGARHIFAPTDGAVRSPDNAPAPPPDPRKRPRRVPVSRPGAAPAAPSAEEPVHDGAGPPRAIDAATPAAHAGAKGPPRFVAHGVRHGRLVASPVITDHAPSASDRAPAPDTAPSAAAAEPPSPSESATAAAVETAPARSSGEVALLSRALTRLRKEADARGALALLDEYDRSYPDGHLRSDALLARIEALLATSDTRGALRILDASAGRELPRSADLAALRGELRSDVQRWAEALADFDRALRGAPSMSVRERALYGRVVCLVRLARFAAARAGADAYLGAFPHGRFAAEMRKVAAMDAIP